MPTLIANRTVPFFNYSHLFSSEEEDLTAIFKDVGRRGAFIMQRELESFEKNLAKYLGARYVLGVANATDGLHIALRAAGLQPGDEVIISSHTMIATAAAIVFAGGVPVPVEAGGDHLMDPASAKAAITPNTRFLMPTQLNGRTCQMDALRAIADKHRLQIVEDAAQALGARYKGRYAGTFGIASAISFYPAKVLGCLGDGGAVITNDAGVYDRMVQLHDHGRRADGEIVSWGMNSRLDNLQAAILDYRLKSYGRIIERRRRIASLYEERLGHVMELRLPPSPDSDPNRTDVYQNYEIEAERRDQLKAHLKEAGIGTLIQWSGKAVHQWPKLGFKQHLPYTDELFRRLLMLPVNMSASDGDIHYICDRVLEFYGR